MRRQVIARAARALAVAAAIGLGGLNGVALAGGYTYQTINFPNAVSTNATAINDGGVVVGYYVQTVIVNDEQISYTHGFMFENGQISTLEPPNASQSEILGIADDGTVVGDYNNNDDIDHRVGFLFKDGVFTFIDVPGSDTVLNSVSHGGIVYGTTSSQSGSFVTGFTDVDGQIVSRRVDGEALVDGFVNDSSTVAGVATVLPNYREQGYFVRNSVPHNFTGAAASFLPTAINNANTVVGTIGDSGYIITATDRSAVNYPGVGFATLNGINGAGDVVGSAYDSTHTQFAFMLSQGNFTTIAPPTSLASGATAINDGGQVIGVFLDSSNPNSKPSFVATPN